MKIEHCTWPEFSIGRQLSITSTFTLNLISMLRNNLIVSYRHLTRQKLNTSLHIIGLTLGMTVCLLIVLFLRYEIGFDRYHANASRTYRINSVWVDSGKKTLHYSTPLPLAEAIRLKRTPVEYITLAHPVERSIVEISPDKKLMQDHMLIVEPSFADVFDIVALSGKPSEVLARPYQALLTESTAKKFFGNVDPVGKTFKIKNEFEITVGGVIRDFPGNTHLPASVLLSYVPNEKFLHNGLDGWTYVSGTETFAVVAEEGDLKRIEADLKSIADQHINSDPRLPKFSRSYFDLQPLARVHFDAEYSGGGEWVQSITTVWLWFFGAIGLTVLLLAVINFMNLSTAQAMTRAREVGVRKSIGAGRANLILQFLMEAWILAIAAGILSVTITQLTLPFVNDLLERQITFDIWESPWILLSLCSGILITGFLAGIYPSILTSRFNPARTLKSSSVLSGDHSATWMRKALVVTQFSISAGLLIALLLISEQVSFLRNQTLGFDKDNIVTVSIEDKHVARSFVTALDKIAQVSNVSLATATPSSQGHWRTVMSLIGRDDPNRQHTTLILADDHYFSLYDLKLKAGRFLVPSDTSTASESLPENQRMIKAVVNEKLISDLGFSSNEDAIGEHYWIGFNSGHVEIVGVVGNFNTSSLHESMTPTTITQTNGSFQRQVGIKIQANSNLPETLDAIEKAWKAVNPVGVFEFKFLDEQIDAFYKAEERVFKLFKVFAAMAMLISCIGLWGLATFSAQQRTKEVGIRKVLGASVNSIMVLLSKDFLFLVVASLIIACPLAYYFADNWLTQFAYHVDIGWKVFVVAAVACMTITLLTVSIQALKAALSNPVDSLRND